MIKKICLAGLATVIWLEPANALDLNLSVQPRFKTGIQYYEFDQKDFQGRTDDPQGRFPNTIGGLNFSDWLPFVSGGLTIFVDRFFVDFDVQYSFDGKDQSTFANQNFIAGQGPFLPDSILQTNSTLNADFDRLEWAFTAGFEVIENLVLFAGYKKANTKFSSTLQGNLNGFQTRDLAQIPFLTGTFTGRLDMELDYDGPFVGASYNWRIKHGFLDGALSFNFAAAFLEGEVGLNLSNTVARTINGAVRPIDFTSLSGQNPFHGLVGDTTGFSFGVGWRGVTPIEGLTYSMGATGYIYEFESDVTADFTETQVRLDFGIAYAFDLL
jgi:hypothetical protein